ncbi:RNA helicase required for poly(A+) mRNA export [Peltigera leucophlebia]|nr:RNA helicase required for poly(A+) mRNA export [Peltigera leucophlebia]
MSLESWNTAPDSVTTPSASEEATTASESKATLSFEAGAENAESDAPPTKSTGQNDGATEGLGGSSGVIEPEYEVNVKLADAQADVDNPLYSVKSFEELGLDEAILKGIYQMRFTKPSKIQEKALPLLLANPPQNMIGQSQSGTGKTAAFVLNILSRVEVKDPAMRKVPQALVLAPTRELARQIIGVVQLMGSFIEGLEVIAGIPQDLQQRPRHLEGQVIVGTPGTTMDLIRKRILRSDQISVLVLDEADNMLDLQGLGDQCIRVKQLLPQNIQTVLFSATFPDQVIAYASKFAPNANQITLRHEELTVEGIKQLYLDCHDEENKYDVLLKLYGLMTIGSSIIFVRTRATADIINNRMTASGHKVASLTGAFDPAIRDNIIDEFRSGKAKVLIATNVLARGIDVQTVSLVVNYDLPLTATGQPDTETYLHRIGRTGRFGRVGVSISLLHNQRTWEQLKEIGDYFGCQLTGVDTSDWDAVEKAVKAIIKSSRRDND